jgi:serine O-acetyltransferase
MTLRAALAADYRGQHPGSGSPALHAARWMTDPSLHAVLLVRGVGAAPPPLRGAVQRLLLCLHASYVEAGVAIGPGLVLKHPVAIVIARGAVVGEDVWLFQDVTLRGAVGDRVRVFTGAVVTGGVLVGADAEIGAGAVVREHVAPRGRARAEQVAAPVLSVGPAPRVAGATGLRATLRADHAARFGPDRAPRLVRAAVADRGFRVTMMVRLMHHGPSPLQRAWRRLLVSHGADIGATATIAPGLDVACPVGVVVGRRARIGAGVRLAEHTCVTPTRTRWRPEATGRGMTVGDGVHVLPGAGAFGDLAIADGLTVAPRALVTSDLAAPADAPRRAGEGCSPPDPRRGADHGPFGSPRAGLVALVRSDLRRLVGAQRGPRARWRALTGLPFQAVVLVRLGTGGPAGVARMARAALRAWHHCYVDAGVRVGPALSLPLPCGIRIDAGTALGAGVTVFDRVSLRAGAAGGAPEVADGAVIGSAAVVVGALTVRGDVPAGGVQIAGPETATAATAVTAA